MEPEKTKSMWPNVILKALIIVFLLYAAVLQFSDNKLYAGLALIVLVLNQATEIYLNLARKRCIEFLESLPFLA